MPRKYYSYTQQEQDWILNNGHKYSYAEAAEYLNKRIDSVRYLYRKFKVKSKNPRWRPKIGLSVKDLVEICGVHRSTVNRAVRLNNLNPVWGSGRKTKAGKVFYRFELEEVRNWVLKVMPMKMFRCHHCKSEIRGDIFCEKDLPKGFEKRDLGVPEKVVINFRNYKEGESEIRKAVNDLRIKRGYSAENLSKSLKFAGHRAITKVQSGEEKNLTLHKMSEIFKELGYTMEVKLTRFR